MTDVAGAPVEDVKVITTTVRAAVPTAGQPYEKNVSTPSDKAKEMFEHAQLPRTLIGGTRAMRKAGKKYLPQEPLESDEAYQNRLERTVLYNAFSHAVRNLAGKMLAKGAKVKEKTPKQIADLLDDVDLQGRNLDVFIKDCVEDAMTVGLTHILVDHPVVGGNQKIPMSVADEKALGVRPYMVHIKSERIIGWKVDRVNGIDKLMMVRIVEHVTVPDGQWDEKEIIQIRVLRPGSWETWREKAVEGGKTEWAKFDGGETTLKDAIPLITLYTRRTDFMEAKPPLDDLAHMNVAHWQSSSDQRHIVHVARVPLLFGTGLDEDQGKVEVGPNRLLKGPVGSDLKYVEHGGSAIRSGVQDLQSIEDKMSVLALEPVLQDKPGTQTATARSIDTAEAQSVMKTVVENIADGISTCFWFMAKWMDLAGTEYGGVTIECDDPYSLTDAAGLQELSQARGRGDISRIAYIKEMKRRGIIAEEYDAEADQALIDQETPIVIPTAPKKPASTTIPPGAPGHPVEGNA
jgi:hypothetical protein